MGLEFFKGDFLVGIGIDFFEDFLGLGGIFLSAWAGLVFLDAHSAVLIGVELLEHFFRIRTLVLSTSSRGFWRFLTETERRGDG
jgi:hypothetical protein